MSDSRFWKIVVVINGAVPLALLTWDANRGELGGNAVSTVLHTTGLLSLIFLLLALTITPLRRLTGWNALIGFRRSLGLLGFCYACLHLGIYISLDRELSIGGTINEVLLRRYLQVGLAALVLLIPLALTSTNQMITRLGARRWKRLHRLAYGTAALGTLHYYMLVKADVRQPLAFAAVLGVLLGARIGWLFLDRRKAAGLTAAATPLHSNRKFWSGELKVARVVDETPEVRTFRLVSTDGGPIPFDFLPGQYLNLHLNIDGRRINRSYTIASSPTHRDYCELSIKREEGGIASPYLHREIREGDRLRIAAPAGKFVFTGAESDCIVLIGGGVGITPLMSITRYLTDREWTGRIFLLLAARTKKDIIFKDELDRLQERFPTLSVHISLTRLQPDETWSGSRGRINQAWLSDCAPDLQRSLIYVCGPDEMMGSVQEMLADIGVPASKIKTEAFVSRGVALRSGDHAVDTARGESRPAMAPASSQSWSSPGSPADLAFMSSIATFARSGRMASLTPETTLLEASEAIGVDLPFECRSGVCGQCKVKLLTGAVAMEVEDAISASEKDAGWVLACQARSTVDVTIDA